MWQLTELGGPYAMDPLITDYSTLAPDETHRVFDVLKANFDAAYGGNRTPFPLYIHSYWLLAGDNFLELETFIGRLFC